MYLRMPFGINTAHEIFQKRITEHFEDLEGVKTIADDNLILGKDETVLQPAHESSATLK